MNKRALMAVKARTMLALLACVQLIWPSRTMAQVSSGTVPVQPAHTSSTNLSNPTNTYSHTHHPINFDLSSTIQNVNANHILHNLTSATIVVNGQNQIVTPTSVLTRAEAVAVSQFLHTGAQSILLGASGNAVGGSFSLTSQLASHISNLVIPQGVTAIDKITSSGTLNISGTLTNSGALYAISLNPTITSATISALNIANLSGGLISTALPGSLPGGAGILPASYTPITSLTLNAANNITNAGTVFSSGNLSLNAGGSITNTSGASLSAANNL